MKTCANCSLELPLYAFSNNKKAKDGKQSYCKKCFGDLFRGSGYHTDYYHKKRKENVAYLIATKIAGGFRRHIRKGTGYKEDSVLTKQLCGTLEDVRKHIESKFVDGMNWENRNSLWVLDHIIPKAYGKTIEDGYVLAHHLNIMPVLKEENYKKSKWVPEDVDLIFQTIKNKHVYLDELVLNHGETK